MSDELTVSICWKPTVSVLGLNGDEGMVIDVPPDIIGRLYGYLRVDPETLDWDPAQRDALLDTESRELVEDLARHIVDRHEYNSPTGFPEAVAEMVKLAVIPMLAARAAKR